MRLGLDVERYQQLPHETRRKVDAWLKEAVGKPLSEAYIVRYELVDEGRVLFEQHAKGTVLIGLNANARLVSISTTRTVLAVDLDA